MEQTVKKTTGIVREGSSPFAFPSAPAACKAGREIASGNRTFPGGNRLSALSRRKTEGFRRKPGAEAEEDAFPFIRLSERVFDKGKRAAFAARRCGFRAYSG